jgi:hypothetical protein
MREAAPTMHFWYEKSSSLPLFLIKKKQRDPIWLLLRPIYERPKKKTNQVKKKVTRISFFCIKDSRLALPAISF